MRRFLISLLPAAALAAALAAPAGAQSAPSPAPSFRPVPGVHDAVTHHTITLDGKRVGYSARAGSLLLRDANDEPTASMFYVAYSADGERARTRPVTFFWNGGPGSSTIWLHMGSFGPVRVQVPANGTQPAPGAPLVDNESSLLGQSDLVFVDAVGTGWSTVVARGKTSDYYGVDEDAKAFTQFVERWLTANGRWESPKFLFGESYGTTRAANVVNLLQNDGVAVNGVVLLSSALDYNVLPVGGGPGEDLQYLSYLPTEAAVAWYHHKVPGNPPDLARFVAEVRAFTQGPYADALQQGDNLSPAARRDIVAKLHQYTGISESYIEAANLRLDPNKFQKELLRGENRQVGRYDGRYAGPDLDANAAYTDYDPSDTGTSMAFVRAFNHYAHDILKYHDSRPYDVLDFNVNRTWKYQRGEDSNAPNVVGDLAAAMTQNPSLHVLSANGYYDLATGFYGTEYLLHHMNLPASVRGNLQFTYYPSGHEVYLNHAALVQFKTDMVRFYRESLAR